MQEPLHLIPSLIRSYYPDMYGITKSGTVWKFIGEDADRVDYENTWEAASFCIVGGYYATSIKGKAYYLHKLLAEVFIENPNCYPNVLHLNYDKLDNALSNLAWGKPSIVTKRAWDTGVMEVARRKTAAKKKERRKIYEEAEEQKRREIAAQVMDKVDLNRRSGQMIRLIVEDRMNLTTIGYLYDLGRAEAREHIMKECQRCGIDYDLIKQIRPLWKHINYKEKGIIV